MADKNAERDVSAPAISESDIPDVMSNDEAASLLEGNIADLLNINLPEEDGDGEDQGDDDRQSAQAEDDDDTGQRDDDPEPDDQDDDDDTGDDDQGDDDQSTTDPDVDPDASKARFFRDTDGKVKPVDEDEPIAFEVAGEEVEMPFSELRDGYMRTRDYTRKTQAISAKVAQGVEEGIAQARSELDERGKTLDGFISLFDGMVPKQPSYETLLRQYNDPNTAGRVFDQQTTLRKKLEEASQEAVKLQSARDQKALDDQTATAKRTLQTMSETDPRWKTDDGARREFASMQKYLGEQGLGEDDLVAILQKPAFVNIVMDAIYGEAVKKAKPRVARKRKNAKVRTRQRTADRPAARPRGDRVELKKRVRQGDEQAALEMIEGLI